MQKFFYFFLLFYIFIQNSKEILINNSVYNFVSNNKYLNYEKGKLQISVSRKYEDKCNFRIKKCQNSLYNIEHSSTNLILTAFPKNLKLVQKLENKKLNAEWLIIETNNNKYIIQNSNKCYIYCKNNELKCENIQKKEATEFYLIKLYEEINHNEKDLEIIEKEPIDVIIKYIDLSDHNLKRKNIPQIKKDEDNQELKYCIRSILKNIPWIRKIFIIMPNEKVRYFKNYKIINKKIIYIKDKDLIGFDSSNIYVFLFNFWRLKYFNASQNIIIMDDDYFIGKPLKKSDFFYVEDSKVVPAIVSKYFREETQNDIINSLKYFKLKAKEARGKQNGKVFWYTVFHTYSFILKLLNRTSLVVPLFNHNAIPCNLNYLKEIYDLAYNSEFKVSTLYSLYRGTEVLQFQTFYLSYFFNRNYNIKVNPISCTYIDVNNVFSAKYNYSLFVINTGGEDYSPISFKKARVTMEKLFPVPTQYEIFNYSSFPSFAFDIIYELDKKLKYFNKKKKKLYEINILILIIVIKIYNMQLINFLYFSYFIFYI